MQEQVEHVTRIALLVILAGGTIYAASVLGLDAIVWLAQ